MSEIIKHFFFLQVVSILQNLYNNNLFTEEIPENEEKLLSCAIFFSKECKTRVFCVGGFFFVIIQRDGRRKTKRQVY